MSNLSDGVTLTRSIRKVRIDRAAAPSRRPWFERLEDRTLLSGNPVPDTILTAPPEPLLGTNIALSAAFTNTGTAAGYGPYVDVILPSLVGNDTDAITYNSGSATYLGAPVVTKVLPFDSAGHVLHPYAENSSGKPVVVTGPPGGELIVIQLPFGSFTVGQPTATVNFSAHINGNDDLNTPIDLQIEGGFQYGADPLNDPTVDPSICHQNDASVPLTTVPVTPALFTVQKVYLGPEQETATGPNFKHQYEIAVSVAPGQTITAFNVSDTLPNNMQFVSLDSETANGGTFQSATLPSTSTPGGSLLVNFDQIVGTGGPTDAKIVFTFYIPLNDSTATAVLPLATAAFATSTDDAAAAGNWNPLDPNDPQNQPVQQTATPNTITDKSIAIQKTVQDITHPSTPIPGDTLTYTVNLQVSDFFAFQGVTVTDTISDGQDFDPLITGFTPTIQYVQHGQTIATTTFSASNFSFTTNADGTITVTFNVSQELSDLGLTTGGKLLGASIPEPNGTGGSEPDPNAPSPGTTGTIVFQTKISDSYRVVHTHSGQVVQGDVMSDGIDISGTLLNFSDLGTTTTTQTDDSKASITLPRGVLTKSVYATDGVHPPNPASPPLLEPNGTVTFEITYTLPSSDVDGMQIEDFLPLPVLPVPASLTFDGATGAAVPAIGHFSLGPRDTLHTLPGTPTPTVSFDTTANSITFDYGNYKDPGNQFSTVDILFTVQVSTEPFADGLLLTNLAQESETSETGGAATHSAIAQIQLTEPNLEITKGVVSTDNPHGVFHPGTVGPVPFAQPGVAGPAFTGTVTSAGLASHPIHSTLVGIDAVDLVKFAIVIENTGTGLDGAFNVEFKDTIPAGFEIPAIGPGLNLQITDGTGASFTVTDLGGGLFGDGLELNDPGPAVGALAPGTTPDGTVINNGLNVAVITYDLETTEAVTPLEGLTNTATLTNYANSPSGPNFIPGGLTSTTTVTIAAPAAMKSLVSTSIVSPNNANNQAVVGETANYSLQVTIPEGVTPAAQIVDTMSAGLAFVQFNSFANSDPSEVTFTGSTTPVVTNNGQTLTVSLGDITNANTDNSVAETLTFNYEVVVLNVRSNVNGTTLTNSAVFSWTGHKLPAVSAAPISVIEPKLQVVKTATPDTGEASNTVTFTIVVSHTSASQTDAQNVVVTDAIPAGLTFVLGSLSNSAGEAPTTLTIVGGTITATYATFSLGASSTLQFQATLDPDVIAGEIITNTASETWTSLPGADPGQITPYNPNAFERTGDSTHGGQTNNYVADGSAQVTVFSPVPSKQLLGTSIVDANNSNSQAVIGELVNYQLTVIVPQGVTPDAQFVDTLPAGLAYVQFVSFTNSNPAQVTLTGDPTNPTVTNNGQIITFNFGTITDTNTDSNVAETLTLDYQTVVLNVASNVNGATLTNSAVFSWTGHTLPEVSAPSVTVIEPKLQTIKSVSVGQGGGNPGDPVQYRITLQQDPTSPTDAFDVTFSDPLPQTSGGSSLILGPTFTVSDTAGLVTAVNFQLTGSDATGWTLATTASGSFDLPKTPGRTITLTVTGTLASAVTPGETITNTATTEWTSLPGSPGQISPFNTNSFERTGNISDPGGALNNYDAPGQATFTVKSADLAVVKTVSDTIPNVGDTVTFTVTLTNNGPDAATNVTVGDPLPAGLQLVSATPSEGTYNGTTGTWTVGTVTTAVPQTLLISATVISPAAQTNVATVTHSDELDPNPSNNTGSATETPQLADLALVKTVSDPTPDVGDTIAFTVTLSNDGPDTATNGTVTDVLPSGLNFVSATPSQGNYNIGNGLWTVGTVTTTTAQTLTITATVISPYAQTNVATISHSDQFDPDKSNNSASAQEIPQVADLQISKVASSPQVIMGQNVTFTLTVHNNGPATATNVTTSDPLPPGLLFIGVGAVSQGSVNGAGISWTVGTLADGATATLQIITQAIALGPIVNTATVNGAQFDPDHSNNMASAQIVGLVPPPLISKRFFLAFQDDPSAFDGTNQRFIAHLYQDLLGREADVDGLGSWSLVLADGGTREQVILGFEDSLEYRADEVQAFYEHFLQRAGSTGEIDEWVVLLATGTTVEQVEAQIVGSTEYFQNRGGGNTTGFLTALYSDGLGRPMDPSGLASWSQALAAGTTRNSVASEVLNSIEGGRYWIEGIYHNYLHRSTDPSGLDGWGNALSGGAGQEEVLALILASDEYFNRP